MHVRLVKTLAAVFPHVASYSSYVPTFGSRWGFILASQQPIATRPEPAETDALLAAQTTGSLRMFDGISLLGMLQTLHWFRIRFGYVFCL
jgi:spermidine synthase